MSSPSRITSPDVGRSRPPSSWSRVLLPEPDGPIRATNSPGVTASETSRTASTVSPGMGYCLVRLRASRIGWSASSPCVGATSGAGASCVMRLVGLPAARCDPYRSGAVRCGQRLDGPGWRWDPATPAPAGAGRLPAEELGRDRGQDGAHEPLSGGPVGHPQAARRDVASVPGRGSLRGCGRAAAGRPASDPGTGWAWAVGVARRGRRGDRRRGARGRRRNRRGSDLRRRGGLAARGFWVGRVGWPGRWPRRGLGLGLRRRPGGRLGGRPCRGLGRRLDGWGGRRGSVGRAPLGGLGGRLRRRLGGRLRGRLRGRRGAAAPHLSANRTVQT